MPGVSGCAAHGLHAEADHIPGARSGRLAASGWRCVLRRSGTNDQENQCGSYRQSHALYLVWGGSLHSGCACAPHSPNYRMSGDADAISFVQSTSFDDAKRERAPSCSESASDHVEVSNSSAKVAEGSLDLSASGRWFEQAESVLRLEAPPGFEPGMEVLQIKQGYLSY